MYAAVEMSRWSQDGGEFRKGPNGSHVKKRPDSGDRRWWFAHGRDH